MKASDISTEAFCAAVRQVSAQTGCPANLWLLSEALSAPVKVVQAKARRLMRQGVIDGCDCGCRGDFAVIDEGRTG